MAGNISIESFATKTRGWYRANYSHFHRNKNWNLFVHSIFFSRTEFSFHLLPYLSILRKDRVNQFEIPGHGRANRLLSRILRFDFKGLNSTKFFFFKELSLTNSLNWDFHLVKKKKTSNIKLIPYSIILENYSCLLNRKQIFLKEVTFFSQVTEARIRNISSSERNGGQLLGKAKLRPV